jgi:hypothetical protein
MLIGSLATIPWIFLADYLRVQRRLRSKAAQLASLVALVTSGSDFAQELQPAGYDTDDSWTAWHPKQQHWQSQEYWSGIVPVAYVRQSKVPSIVVPFDWTLFLAWKLPAGSALPGLFLPFHGPGGSSFRVRSVQRLRHCPEWTVINAELYDESYDLQATVALVESTVAGSIFSRHGP